MEIMTAEMTGHIHHFADEIEVGVVVGGHSLGRKLAGVDAAESDFGGAVAFGAGGFDGPALEGVGDVFQVAVLVGL